MSIENLDYTKVNNGEFFKLVESCGPQVAWDLDVVNEYQGLVSDTEIREIQKDRIGALQRGVWSTVIDSFAMLPRREDLLKRGDFTFAVKGPAIEIGDRANLTEEEFGTVEETVRLLRPWRKGPFDIFGIDVDAEWRSDLKYSRIAPHLESLRGKRVADIGCGNGYYMFRALSLDPELIIGFDPYEQFYFSFHLIQRYLADRRLSYQLLGLEHITLFPEFFDVVMCMGILYHQKNPIDALKGVFSALKAGGQLILESQGIPGEGSFALFPEDRYAQMRNVYFVPTADCLKSWAKRAGFVNVEIISAEVLTTDEQRSTYYGPVQSLSDYLNPADPTETVEGYPAPLRIALKADKPA